jgi:hypothetical protein
MHNRRLAVVVLSGVALAVSGCGGSSSNSSSSANASSSPSKPLTRTEFITDGDAICKRVNTKVFTNPIRTIQVAAHTAPQLAAYEQAAIKELTALRPPLSLAGDWRTFLSDYSKLAKDTVTFGKAAAAGSFAGIRSISLADDAVHTQMLAVAKRDGFKVCSRAG